MAMKPSAVQARNASRPVTGKQAVEMVANASERMGAMMADAGIVAGGAGAYALATNDINKVGEFNRSFDPSHNEFAFEMVNVIGLQLAWFRAFDDPWAQMDKGRLADGETIQEFTPDLPTAHRFSAGIAETQVFRRELPAIYAAYHRVNMKRFYKRTIEREKWDLAFHSWSTLGNAVNDIIASMTTAMKRDHFDLKRYMLAKAALNGAFTPIVVPALTKDTANDVLTAIREVSDNFEFEDNTYNAAGVDTNTPKSEQMLVQTTPVSAYIDVNSLAQAFNVSYAEWVGRQLKAKNFTKFNWARLTELFTDPETNVVDPDFHQFTDVETAKLDGILGLFFDVHLMQVWNKDASSEMLYNPQGKYWNHFLHSWDIYSLSPFANAVAFVTDEPTVTGITVTPATANVLPGSTIQMSAAVAGTGLFPTAVTWKVSGRTANTSTRIEPNGVLVVAGNEGLHDLTVTATSIFDSSKSGTATITVGNGSSGK